MYEINRSAIVLKPKQAFVDWVNSCPDSEDEISLESILRSGDQSMFLIPEVDSDEHLKRMLKGMASMLLEEELWGWYTDTDAWPKKLDFRTFSDFFDIELCSMVKDTLDSEILREEVD